MRQVSLADFGVVSKRKSPSLPAAALEKLNKAENTLDDTGKRASKRLAEKPAGLVVLRPSLDDFSPIKPTRKSGGVIAPIKRVSQALEIISQSKPKSTEQFRSLQSKLKERFAHLLPKDASYKELSKDSDKELSKDASYKELPHLSSLSSKGIDAKSVKSVNVRPKTFSHKIHPSLKVDLPISFETIDLLFDALESTIMFLSARGESTVFHRMQKSVELVASRTFSLDLFVNIIGVFPEAYNLTPVKIPHQGRTIDSYSIEFNPFWFRKRDIQELETPKTDDAASSKAEFALVDVPKRRNEFRRRLIEIIDLVYKNENKEINKGTRIRWDPEFDANSVKLPIGKLPSYRRNSTALTDSTKPTLASVRAAEETNKPEIQGNKPASDRYASLLERIKAKQAKREADQEYELSPQDIAKRTMLARLYTISSSVKTFFNQSEKQTIALSRVAQCVADSYPVPLSPKAATDHLILLSETVPEYLIIVDIAAIQYVKIKEYSLTRVKSDIDKAINQLKRQH